MVSIIGCGSGGGGGPKTDPPPEVSIDWSRPLVTGTAPVEVPSDHAAVFDPIGERILMAWGIHASSLINETWELRSDESGKLVWRKLLPASDKALPDPRAGHSAVYDLLSKRVLIFGGETEAGPSDEVWEIDFKNDLVNGAWRLLSPSGEIPPARTGHSAVFDLENDRVIVFGGWNGDSTFYNDVRELDLGNGDGTWEKIDSGQGPSGRAEHTAVLDVENSRMIIFGGWDGNMRLNDIWELDWSTGISRWQKLEVSGSSPDARSGHTAVHDPVGQTMVVFGGFNGARRLDDVWMLDLSGPGSENWALGAAEGSEAPSVREQHIAIREANAGLFRMLVFGGNGDSDGEVWTLK